MNAAVGTFHRTDQDALFEPGDLSQLHARQRRALADLKLQDLHSALCKGIHRDHGREFQNSRHLQRAGQLRIDGQTEAQIFFYQRHDVDIFRISHPRDGRCV